MRDPLSDYILSTPHMDSNSHQQNQRGTPRENHCRNYLSEYAIDRDSVFVGNLPIEWTVGQVADLFHECGEIVDIKLHHAQSTRPGDYTSVPNMNLSNEATGFDVNVFAFIQFSNPITVREAIRAKVSPIVPL
jgi:RNA recognition motif-containing protein